MSGDQDGRYTLRGFCCHNRGAFDRNRNGITEIGYRSECESSSCCGCCKRGCLLFVADRAGLRARTRQTHHHGRQQRPLHKRGLQDRFVLLRPAHRLQQSGRRRLLYAQLCPPSLLRRELLVPRHARPLLLRSGVRTRVRLLRFSSGVSRLRRDEEQAFARQEHHRNDGPRRGRYRNGSHENDC